MDLTPLQLSVLAGFISSHVVEPLSNKIPDAWKPAAIALGTAAATALAAISAGTPVPAALGLGLASVASAKLTHTILFKNGGLLNLLQGMVQGLSQPAPAALPVAVQVVPGPNDGKQ